MKYKTKKRFLSLVLCISMLIPMFTQAIPMYSSAATSNTPTDLEANVGKQSIFDWWTSFDVAEDEASKPGNVLSVSYEDLEASDLVVLLEDYYYDDAEGAHWYKVKARDGETLPAVLAQNPWVLYTYDFEIEEGFAPYLCIYDADEEIRFVSYELITYQTDEDGNVIEDGDGNPVIADRYLNYYVFSGPAELKNAEISIKERDLDYPVSDLAYVELTYSTTFSKAFDIAITKSNGDLWQANDGLIGIRYEAAQFGSDTYTEDCSCGAGFVYIDGQLYSATSTDRWGYEISDLVYTNSGASTIVFEIMDSSFEYVGESAYFKNDKLTLYSNTFESDSFLAAELPLTFTVEYSFKHTELDTEYTYYWLESKGFIGSVYFLAKEEDVEFGKLPEEFGDGRVSVTDKNGDVVDSEFSFSMYAKPELHATSSLSQISAYVDYQWQKEYEDGKWVNVFGEDKKTIKLSYAMLSSLLDEENTVNMRCRTRSGSAIAYSSVFSVTLDIFSPQSSDPVVTKRLATPSKDTLSLASYVSDDASLGTENAGSYSVALADQPTEYVITILRQFESGKIAAATWSAQQIAGATESYELILPDVVGYVPWIDTDNDGMVDAEAPKNSDGKYVHQFTVSNISENVEMKVIYKPGIVNYTVVYMFQNVYDDDYTPYGDPVIMQGLADSELDIEMLKKPFNGMEFFSYDSNKTTIASDGSTLIKLHYDRNYYLMTFDLAGGQGVEPIFARYGTPLNINAPVRFGYTFSGWTDENGTELNLPATMPSARNKYVATWTPGPVSFIVVFWYENADPEADGTYGYTYVGYASIKGITAGSTVNSASYQDYNFDGRDEDHDEHFTYNASKGESITVAGDGSSVLNVYYTRNSYTLTIKAEGKCVLEPHTHSNACYEIGCGLEVHSHTNCARTQICGKVEHTQHTADCYNCVGYEHSHSNSCCKYGGTGWDHWYHRDSCCKENKTEHTHNNGCYRDSLHTHSDSCYSYSCGKSEHAHTNSCNVLTCTKTAHTHTNSCNSSNSENAVKVITRKYDASLIDIWPIVDDHNVKYEEYKWKSNITGDYYAFLAKMPGYDLTLTESGNSGEKKTWHYYLEILPGQSTDGLTIRQATQNGVSRTYYQWFTSVAHNVGNLTYAEDYFPITGFTQRDQTVPSFSNNVAYLYYTRNVHTLTFYNYNDDDKVYGSIPYETGLGQYNYIPENPLERPEGAYEFKGWYLTHECVTGTEVDLANMKMPDNNLILYAKWQPIEHNVKVFDDANLTNQIGNHTVLHGDTFVSASEGYTYDPTIFKNPPKKPVGKEDYDFVYWFYMDNGVEKTFDYESTPITKDINVYAKWMTKAYGTYTVYYKLGSIDGPDVAAPTVAESIVGVNKTFDAKTESQLYPQYQSGYFPDKPSTAITIEEDITKNVVYFIYTAMPLVPYTVHYYDTDTNQPLVIDGVAVPPKVVDDNKDAIVVEDYQQILGYVPDAMQKRLVLSSDPDLNKIIFYYTKDEVNAPFQESHYIQNIDGSYNDGSNGTLDDPYKSNNSILPMGTHKEASPLTIPGFTFDNSNVNNVISGTISSSGLRLKLYYLRNSYPYMIRHVIAGTGEELIPSLTGTGLFEEQFVGYPQTNIPGYRCTTSASVSKLITIESGTTPVINVITFEYEEIPVSLNYVLVDPDGNTFTDAQSCGSLSSYTENVGMMTGFASGSTASASSNVYKFVGWYNNAACIGNPISTNATYIPTKEDGANWVDGTTYYAKFVYNLTSLTINKQGHDPVDENQSFLFKLSDEDGLELVVTIHGNGSVTIDGLTVGKKYKIIESNEWSWRYTNKSIAKDLSTVVITDTAVANGAEFTLNPSGNVITFTNERSKPYWLDGDSWCNNIFKNN